MALDRTTDGLNTLHPAQDGKSQPLVASTG